LLDQERDVNPQLVVDPLAGAAGPAVTSQSFPVENAPDDVKSAQDFYPRPDLIQEEINQVLALKLSRPLAGWVEGYTEVGHRDPFLWTWARRGVEVTRLTCVDGNFEDEVGDTKVLGVMLDVMLDDVADYQKDLAFLEQILHLLETGSQELSKSLLPHQRAYARFTLEIWNEIQRRVRAFPRHAEFAELLQFDYRQLFNVMRYSRLMDEYPEMFNLVEHDMYLPHNMHMMVSSTMDLMCSPRLDRSELGIVREAVWRGQCMGRIGNMITTWQREIGEDDFTSGVFARAIACGDLKVSDLWSGNREYIEGVIRGRKHEEHFLEKWQAYRREILALAQRCRCVNLNGLVDGLQRLICLHLGSRGRK
jgi:hypothetical protein